MVKALAILGSLEGVTGTISFVNESDGAPTIVTGNLAGLKPGLHRFHVHALDDTTNGCMSTVNVQNSALMLIACTAGFVLQWRLALVLISVFPVIVAATVLHKMFMKGFSDDLEVAHSRATQIASEAVANVRTAAAFNSEGRITELFAANLKMLLRLCFWKGQITGSGFGVAQFLLYASYALGLWYGVWLVKHSISDFGRGVGPKWSRPTFASASMKRTPSPMQSTTSFRPGYSRSRPASG